MSDSDSDDFEIDRNAEEADWNDDFVEYLENEASSEEIDSNEKDSKIQPEQ